MEYANEELSEIKRLRKKHSLTQTALAKLAMVSQSLIAKIESGRIDPTFSHVKRIFHVLHGMEGEKEPRAEELITHKIITVDPNDPVTEAVKKMKANNISQLPVNDNTSTIGLISESDIIERIAEGKNPAALKVKDFMTEAPPIVSKSTSLTAVAELLRHSPLVVVAENGKPKGVITKSDILKRMM